MCPRCYRVAATDPLVLLFFAVAVAFSGLLSGCASSKAPRRAQHDYKRVHLLRPSPDPRAVQPRIASRLRALGFDVREVAPQQTPVVSQGTGFVVSEAGHVLTCAHVLGNEPNATLWINGQRHEALLLRSDTNLDLALLQIQPPVSTPTQPMVIADAAPLRLGQTIFTLGFPLSDLLGRAPRLTKGLVSATVGIHDNPQQYQVSAEVQPGNSGGPLLTENGEVVGIIAATLNPLNVLASGGNLPQNVNFALKGSGGTEFLKANGVPLRRAQGTNTAPVAFEDLQTSVALVRAGLIPAGAEQVPELVCAFSYVYFWDIWYRFRVLRIDFFDMKTGERIFEAGKYRVSPFITEEAALDRVFVEIRKFFRGQ